MTHDLEHLTAIAEAQHRAYKRATRRLQHRRRLEQVRDVEPRAWLQAIKRDDMTDPELATVERERVPAEQTV